MYLAGLIQSVSIMYREDLDLKNHLAGHQRKLMKIVFDTTQVLPSALQANSMTKFSWAGGKPIQLLCPQASALEGLA